jgi:hypothetical protein
MFRLYEAAFQIFVTSILSIALTRYSSRLGKAKIAALAALPAPALGIYFAIVGLRTACAHRKCTTKFYDSVGLAVLGEVAVIFGVGYVFSFVMFWLFARRRQIKEVQTFE